MRRFPASLAAVLLAAAALHPAAAQMTRTTSAEYRPNGGGGIGYEHLHNASIVRAEVYGPERQLLLLVDAVELWPEVEDETVPGATIQVQALEWDSTAFTRPLWTVDAPAHAWDLEPAGFLRLSSIWNGGYRGQETHTLYDLHTGREVAWYTHEPLEVMDERMRMTLVAFESPRSTRASPAPGDGVQGMLRIVRGARMTAQLVLTGTDTDRVHPRVVLCDAEGRVNLMVPAFAAGPRSAFHACLQFQGGAWAVLPVREGRFVLEDARLPPGVTARRGSW
jgi:hypothetical protein